MKEVINLLEKELIVLKNKAGHFYFNSEYAKTEYENGQTQIRECMQSIQSIENAIDILKACEDS